VKDESVCSNVCRLDCLTLCTGLPYNQRHSVDVAMCPSQGSGSGSGAVGSGQNYYSVINGDSSQQDSGNTTPLAFDYETRSCVNLCLLDIGAI